MNKKVQSDKCDCGTCIYYREVYIKKHFLDFKPTIMVGLCVHPAKVGNGAKVGIVKYSEIKDKIMN